MHFAHARVATNLEINHDVPKLGAISGVYVAIASRAASCPYRNSVNPSPLTLVLSLFVLAAPLAGADLQALLDNSPFGKPPAKESIAEATSQVPLEFRSLIVEDQGRYFSVFDPAAQRGYWLSENNAEGEIVINSYDEEARELVVSQSGRVMRLPLKSANIIAGAVPTVAAPAQPNGRQAPQVNRDSAADARRLEAVAAEVRRRRALRQAAASNTTN